MNDYCRARKALEEVARRDGITLEEVVYEIEDCIAEAIENCKQQNNKVALRKWASIPRTGETPNAFELVAYIGNKVRQKPKCPNPLTGTDRESSQ